MFLSLVFWWGGNPQSFGEDGHILFLKKHGVYLVERWGERRQNLGEVLPIKAIGIPEN